LPTINELLANEEVLDSSEYFKGIFGRSPQIRTILSSVKSFLESDGQRRNHVLLYGLPACAKTQILNAISKLLGQDAVVRLDGTSTTPAGIYKVYFQEFLSLRL
jgi:MoxR-like ATPase